MKQLDETAGRLGIAMRNARRICYIPHDEVAYLLHITPKELAEYEQGIVKIPFDILERILIYGYRTMHARVLEGTYRKKRFVFNKLQKLEREQMKNAQ